MIRPALCRLRNLMETYSQHSVILGWYCGISPSLEVFQEYTLDIMWVLVLQTQITI